MQARTSQLQIRISPDQKAALKRLAGRAGQTVSAYVLAKALPTTVQGVDGALKNLRAGGSKPSEGVRALREELSALQPGELSSALEQANVPDLSPVGRNYAAGAVEEIAHARGIDPPAWAAQVPALERPHFLWQLTSLRPHQLRMSPIAFKRRNVFDPSLAANPMKGEAPGAPEGLEKLRILDRHLMTLELDVEFYFLGGAVLHQVFPAVSTSARPRAMFRPPGLAVQAVGDVEKAQGWMPGWLESSIRTATLVDLPHLKVFTPPREYALAMKVAAATQDGGPQEYDDLRFLLRSLNVTSAEGARAIVGRYFPERHLSPYAKGVLNGLLGG